MVTYLIDTSAYLRTNTAAVRDRLESIASYDIRVALPLVVEVGWSARGAEDHLWAASLLQTFPFTEASGWAQRRCVEVQGLLASRGQHRSAGLADLFTAAVAEQRGLTVLHYDQAFDMIAAVTGQAMEWVVPAGSVD